MANTVRLKRSAVQGKAPVVGDLSLGELAVNTYDGKLYMKKNDGSDAIVEIGAGGTTVSATAPSSPSTGDLWYDTEDARTFVWTGTEWVDAAPDSGYAVATTSDSAPANANDGDLWYRTSDGRLYVYYDDGSTAQWVDANPNLPVGSDSFERSGTTVSLVNSGDTVSLDGDLTVDTNTLHVDSANNRVGIGTTSPDARLHITENAVTAYNATAADGQVGVGPTLYLENPANANNTVGGQIVFGMRSTEAQARITATGGVAPQIAIGCADAEVARFTSDGLTFNGDTAATNALDDYEEGTWTPFLEGATTAGTFTYSSRVGTYTKIGRQVSLFCSLAGITTGTASSGSLLVKGLPFTATAGGGTNAIGTLEHQSVDLHTNTRSVNCLIVNSQNQIFLREVRDNLVVQNTTGSQLNSGSSNIILTITYFTD